MFIQPGCYDEGEGGGGGGTACETVRDGEGEQRSKETHRPSSRSYGESIQGSDFGLCVMLVSGHVLKKSVLSV